MSSFFEPGELDGGDNEPYDDFKVNRAAVIYLVDFTEPNFQPYGSDPMDCPFTNAIDCIQKSMRKTIVESDKDLAGVVFFGAEKTKIDAGVRDCSDRKHIYTFQPLGPLCAKSIKELLAILEDQDSFCEFTSDLGHNEAYSLGGALDVCLDLFKQTGIKGLSQNVFIFTSRDDPHPDSQHLKDDAYLRANYLLTDQVNVVCMALQPPNNIQFRAEKFYAALERRTFETSESCRDFLESEFMQERKARMAELTERVYAKDHKKRSQAQLTWQLGANSDNSPGAALAVKMYTLVRRVNKPTAQYATRDTNTIVKRSTTLYREAQADEKGSDVEGEGEVYSQVLPQDVLKYQEYGGKRALFELHEVNDLKDFGPAGIELLGFKPLDSLKFHTLYLRHGNFLYPDDKAIGGSTKIFSALLDRCLARKVYALCRIVTRKRQPPRLAALVPLAERKTEDGRQDVPPGFNVCYLPYGDDRRKLDSILNLKDSESPTTVERKAVEATKKLLTSIEEPRLIHRYNPALQKLWRHIESSALGLQRPDVKDNTLPPEDRIPAPLKEQYNSVLPSGVDSIRTPAKRSLNSQSGGEDVAFEVERAHKSGNLNKLTVKQMKDYLQNILGVSNGVSAMKKPDLLAYIDNHFRSGPSHPRGGKKLKVEEDD